ncbi:uncharacterized protein N7483_002444 [Penicillium malachiteum]|uniref:uncharacterized protein n=1 Tax=Penicillium malachiteum TaxID=1324776 RepID=UPI002548B9CF|nr:uncharacterized protein N7483_002444 [Penicillium malachiteum]KAJ5737319.1 hypothetical protein N7483_002444 [Penicillium malachiteum]
MAVSTLGSFSGRFPLGKRTGSEGGQRTPSSNNIMSHERRFPFPNGDDKAYIRYLEELVIMGQVLKTHQLTGPVSQQKWMRQLDHFTENILKLVASDDAWNERRQSSGVATPARNATALNLILGCQVNAIYADNLPAGNPVLAPSPSGDYHDLVLNGYRYGEFMISCKEDRDFAKTVVAFQNLVFCSYCLVISEIMKSKGSGADKSTPAINKMMRAYLDGSQDDKTLRKYRGGAKWYNRCMATLLANGWGYKAWEIFLLGMCRGFSDFRPR